MIYVFIIILIICFFIYIFKDSKYGKIQVKDKGRRGELLVADVLKSITDIMILNNVKLPLYNGYTEIDHIVFGKFGIAVIETKSISGSVTGNVNDRNLVHNIGTKIHNLYNPVLQNKTHVDNLNYHLRKNGYINLPVYSIVVFTDGNINICLKGHTDTKIIKIHQLKSYINYLKQKNYNLNYQEVCKKIKMLSK